MFNSIQGEVFDNEPVAPYTSWNVGGACRYMIFPKDVDDLSETLKIINKNNLPFVVIGKGTNILKSDDFFDGVVINLSKSFNEIEIKDNRISVGSSFMLPKLAFYLAKNSIGGFDFYAGIPGTVGGAVVMNAGSAGKETKDVMLSVTYLNLNLEIVTETVDQVEFAFRNSKFLLSDSIIISVDFKKEYCPSERAMKSTKEIADRRRKKFPLNVPTAGSTFKSPPEGPHPGKLIDELGLKGYQIGGARISPLHGNWIENIGGAKASDIQALINDIHSKVKEIKDVEMETEVLLIP
ncbi:UDP-N-acetylmuramate dehydrogenase [Evansella sp. AB-P1]|uniref:UDP-N-acetylmuramate dehydrogenase n=1 Tax=Evansella sp. AB-P1 TaxID=3037653 RepID=UPI0024203C0C|nr:UDP-N-acetylmuramate dehydrogenase [Evansella sp. AB-P1]MDG5789307.1 UDP-N-acetylmuramate dehydrogenase [Evansella sp. AB-P1]